VPPQPAARSPQPTVRGSSASARAVLKRWQVAGNKDNKATNKQTNKNKQNPLSLSLLVLGFCFCGYR
jgi:hypothetical protein